MGCVLVYERLCAEPPSRTDASVAGLAAEGRAMLAAAARALAEVPDTRVSVCAAESFDGWDILSPRRFPAAAGEFDQVLLIAPEIDGLAAQLAADIVAAGGRLLGPGPELIVLASDKLATAAALGELAPPEGRGAIPPPNPDILVKPRDGVGALFTVRGPAADAPGIVAMLRDGGCRSELLVQPWLDGVSASVALLGRGAEPPIALPAARQRLEERPHPANPAWRKLHYFGGTMPLAEPWQSRAVDLATRAAELLPPWRGYLGIDVMLTEDGDFVLDVNPRLTTSFLGYSKLLPGRMGRFLLGTETPEDRDAVVAARRAAAFDYAP